MFAIAEHLHITVSEVMKMSLIEFKGWLAYLNIKAKEQKKQDGYTRANNIRRR
jgi:hypothetical protein